MRELKSHEQDYRGFIIECTGDTRGYFWAGYDFDGAPIDHETPTQDPHGSGTVEQCKTEIDQHLAEVADKVPAFDYYESIPQRYKDAINSFLDVTKAEDYEREHLQQIVGMVHDSGKMGT